MSKSHKQQVQVESKPSKQVRYASKSWGPTSDITVLKSNPKVPGSKSHARFELHAPGQTVAQYAALVGKSMANLDLRWGAARGFYSFS